MAPAVCSPTMSAQETNCRCSRRLMDAAASDRRVLRSSDRWSSLLPTGDSHNLALSPSKIPHLCPTSRAGRHLPGPAGTVLWMSLEVPARIGNRRQFSTWPPGELENGASSPSAAAQHWHQLAAFQKARQRTSARRRRWVAPPGTPDLPQIRRGRWAVSVAAGRSDQVPLPV